MRLYIDQTHYFESNEGIDLSISMGGENDARAWYVDATKIDTVRANGFVGSVKEGGSVNFRNITFNPHGNGTHTECLGHITEEVFSINELLKDALFEALLVTVQPVQLDNGDWVVTKEMLQNVLGSKKTKALLIRTLPNTIDKRKHDYSSTNPAYLMEDCIEVLDQAGVEHLLIDLPSVDRESDNGVLAMHHAFWSVPSNPHYHKTITELIFVPNEVADGAYILNLQVAPFVNDASPSKPVIYPIKKN
jgi:arylformamidase